MRKTLSIILAGTILLTTLSACASQEPTIPSGQTLIQTLQAGGRQQRGTFVPGQGGAGRTPGAGGMGVPGAAGTPRAGGATFPGGAAVTTTPQASATPEPTATPTKTPTPQPTATATPTVTLTRTATLAYDSRITITNNTYYEVEFLLYGPIDIANPITVYVKIKPQQTGFLRAPHGRYKVTILKNGVGTTGTYEIKYGGWNCKLIPDGCTDAFFPVK